VHGRKLPMLDGRSKPGQPRHVEEEEEEDFA